MTLEIHSYVSFPYRLNQRGGNHYFWICSSSTLLCQEEVPLFSVSACGSVLGELHIFDLKPAETVLWPLLAVLYPENWVTIWVDDWTYYCGQMSLPCLGHLSPQVLNIYMRKSKNILPLAKAYFLWEDVAFSKTFQHETWFYIKDFWMFIVSFSLIYMLLEKILLQQAPVKSFMNVQ